MYWFYKIWDRLIKRNFSKTIYEFEIKLLDQERLRAGRKINEDIIATKVKFIIIQICSSLVNVVLEREMTSNELNSSMAETISTMFGLDRREELNVIIELH